MSQVIVVNTATQRVTLLSDPDRPGAYVVRIGTTDQSYVDLADPLHLEFDYVQRIAEVIDSIAPPGRRIGVVHVGGAALTLPRYVAATRPRSAQVVLEPDSELTQLVREHLPLPRQSGIKVRAIDGRAGIAALRDDYADLVVVDAFAGSRVPAELTTLEFFAELRRVVGERGTAVLNVTDQGRLDYARRVLAGVLEVFPNALLVAEPATLKGRRFGNLVITGSGLGLSWQQLGRQAAGAAFPHRLLSGEQLRHFVAGASAFTDQTAEPSPDPAGGRAYFG